MGQLQSHHRPDKRTDAGSHHQIDRNIRLPQRAHRPDMRHSSRPTTAQRQSHGGARDKPRHSAYVLRGPTPDVVVAGVESARAELRDPPHRKLAPGGTTEHQFPQLRIQIPSVSQIAQLKTGEVRRGTGVDQEHYPVRMASAQLIPGVVVCRSHQHHVVVVVLHAAQPASKLRITLWCAGLQCAGVSLVHNANLSSIGHSVSKRVNELLGVDPGMNGNDRDRLRLRPRPGTRPGLQPQGENSRQPQHHLRVAMHEEIHGAGGQGQQTAVPNGGDRGTAHLFSEDRELTNDITAIDGAALDRLSGDLNIEAQPS